MKASTKRLISIFMSALFLISAVAVYSYLIKPVYKDIQTKRGEWNAVKTILEQERFYLDKAKQFFSQYNEALNSQKDISAILPSDIQLAEATNQFVNIANISNLEISKFSSKSAAIKPSVNSSVKSIGVVKFNVTLSGDYESFNSFLERIETNIRIFSVDSVKINSQSFGANLKNMIYTLEIETYYQTK